MPAKTLERTGSSMSSKQMAYAALHGRSVTARFIRCEIIHETTGYLVGADDYHWLIATPQQEPGGSDLKVVTNLIAKGRVEIMSISPDNTLDKEPPAIKVAISEMSQGFRAICERTYFGGSEESEEPNQ